jgi:FMN phosphatase YigB (HAD superfamily)
MRAKTVKIPRAYIFDFDDTLVKTDARIHIYINDKKIKSITPEEYNTYHKKPEEELDLSDFIDPRFILNATKYKLWPALENIVQAKKMGRSDSDIYILTARPKKAQIPIYTFLHRNKIDIPIDNIITIGDDAVDKVDIAASKEKILRTLMNQYTKLFFFDDSAKNIKIASKIPGIKTRLVDWNK